MSNEDSVPSITSSVGGRSKMKSVLEAFGTGFGMFLLIGFWSVVLAGLSYAILGEISIQIELLASNIALGLAAVVTGAIYFRYTDKTVDFVDLRVPTLTQTLLVIVGVVALLIFAIGIEFALGTVGISTSDHEVFEAVQQDGVAVSPEFVLLLVPLSILIIGPAEEFVFRNLVQKSLYGNFSKMVAVVIASLIFAIVHFPAYLTGNGVEAGVMVLNIFVLSLLLGGLYAYTENLVVVSLVHGIYNAVLFTVLYLELVGAI